MVEISRGQVQADDVFVTIVDTQANTRSELTRMDINCPKCGTPMIKHKNGKEMMTQNNQEDREKTIPEYDLETDISEYSPIAQRLSGIESMGSLAEPDLCGKVRGWCGDNC